MIFDEFLDFINERHSIYLRRTKGEPAPWTEDPMLRAYKFTNIYRELDRTTIWCKENVRYKYEEEEYTPFQLAWSIVAFRFFNRIKTGEAMFNTAAWDFHLRGIDILRKKILEHCGHGPYTTGAYIIKTVNGMSKLDGALWAIEASKIGIQKFIDEKPDTLAKAQSLLLHVPYFGSFMAAQVIADMKYTKLLIDAKDWHTWAASGPGSRRGLNLLINRDVNNHWREKDWLAELQFLREKMMTFFVERNWEVPHAQDVQNMLCEFSKYKRGYSRNKFVPSK